MLKADLHVHTTHSDGKLSPAEMVKTAAACGLSTLSITDHDTFSGYLEARQAALEAGISLISGIELTTVFKHRECHLLGYGFDPLNKELCDLVRFQRESREKRTAEILFKLEQIGIKLDIREIPSHQQKTPGRPQIATLMLQKGLVRSTKEAFDRYLGEHAPAYSPLHHLTIERAIEILHLAGGVAILAHPGNRFSSEELRYLQKNGIDGLEFLHPAHTWPIQKKHADWADSNGLLATGGSDFHGFSSRDRQFLGTVAVGIPTVAALRKRIHSKRNVEVI